MLFIGVWLAGGALGQQRETLRQKLAAHRLTMDPKIGKNLDQAITSGAELDTPTEFVIGYYADDGSGLLKAPIHFARYDRTKGVWDFADVTDGSVEGLQDACFGSVLSIKAVAGFYVVDTHISPSAGCLLVLTADMKVHSKFFGWYLGHVGDRILVYHRNQVHFATVHPAEIATFDLQSKKDTVIFPRKPDQQVRLDLIAALDAFYTSHPDYCQQNNDPCDPEYFDSSLEGEIVTDNREHAVAFVISYEVQGYGQSKEKPSGPPKVVYVYRHVNDEAKLEYREILIDDLQVRYGAASLERLVDPEILVKLFDSDAAKKRPRPVQ